MAGEDPNLFIDPTPINTHNLMRWHPAAVFLSDNDEVEGYTRCSAFSNGCGQEVYALPSRPGDFVIFQINNFKNYHLAHPEGPSTWELRLLTCCEVGELDGTTLRFYTEDGTQYTKDTLPDGEPYYVGGYFNTPDLPIGSQYNICIYNTATSEPAYVSNPFRVIDEQTAQCETLIVFPGHEGQVELGGEVYFPVDLGTEIRIDGKLIESKPVTSNKQYTTLAGETYKRDEVQVKQFTLITYFLDEPAHEGMSTLLGYSHFELARHEYYNPQVFIATEGYEVTPNDTFGRYTGQATLRLKNKALTFRTC